MTLDIIHGDRRADRRYSSSMELRFHWTQRRQSGTGFGITVDLSSTAIRFTSTNPPPDGCLVELHIAWPFLLQDTCPLDLVVNGRAVTRGVEDTIVQMARYEFRTRGQRSFEECAEAPANWSVVG